MAEETCYHGRGTDYRGEVDHSASGFYCQRWDSQFPQIHDNGHLGDEGNFCRNPDNEPGGPWCYNSEAEKPRWDYCDITQCAPVDGINGQCRPFTIFTEEYLPTCHPYLDNNTHYYLADTPFLDDPEMFGLSLIGQIAATIESVMNRVCASNVISLVCRTAFRECYQVKDKSTGNQLWLPSLLCRSECERHWATWNMCVDDIASNPDAKREFDSQMSALADLIAYSAELGMHNVQLPAASDGSRTPFQLLNCDSPGGAAGRIAEEDNVNAFIFGQQPAIPVGFGDDTELTLSLHYPPSLDTSHLYPNESSIFEHPDGKSYSVACFVPGKTKEIPEVECPAPFVNPKSGDHIESCIQPCPVQAYSDDEYTLMWSISNAIGLFGLCLNLFMATTWIIAGRLYLSCQPFQLKYCVGAGVLFGMVGTLPSLVLKYDLACECDTQECTGTSTICAINRISIYILLSILINLSVLTFQVARKIHFGLSSANPNTKMLDVLSATVPIIIAAIGYVMEVDLSEGENARLNTARHAFSCTMRFPDMKTEWLALWCHFFWSGFTIIISCIAAWRKFGMIIGPAMQLRTKSEAEREGIKKRRRLLQIALMISVCLLLNVIASLSTSLKLEEWNRTSDILLACELGEIWGTRDWGVYGFSNEDSTSVCAEEDSIGFLHPCVGGCVWFPDISEESLVCNFARTKHESLEEAFEALKDSGDISRIFNPCSCSCDYLIQVERPSVVQMTMTHVAQSLVVAIVGLNLGFRRDNLNIWKKFFRKHSSSIPGATTFGLLTIMPMPSGETIDSVSFKFDSSCKEISKSKVPSGSI